MAAGQSVFVLTTLMSSKDENGKNVKEWRPIGVVTSGQTADQWTSESSNNDWIPLELDDLSLTGLAEHSRTNFEPKKPQPTEVNTEQALKNIKETNERLINIMETLAVRYKDKALLSIVKQMRGEAAAQAAKPSQRTSARRIPDGRRMPFSEVPNRAPRERDWHILNWDEATLQRDGFEGEDLEEEKDRRWRLSGIIMAQATFFETDGFLYHGTTLRDLKSILTDGKVEGISFWGVKEMADMYEGGAMLRVPFNRFKEKFLLPDENMIQDPYFMEDENGNYDQKKMNATKRAWKASKKTWMDSLKIWGAVMYDEDMPITPADAIDSKRIE